MIIYETALTKPIAAMGAPVSVSLFPAKDEAKKRSATRRFWIATGAVSIATGILALKVL